MTEGVQDVVTKPIAPDDLWRALRTLGRSPGAFDAAQPRLPEGIEGLGTTLSLKRVLGKVSRYMAMLER